MYDVKGDIVMEDIKVVLTQNPKQKPQDESKLGFGSIFTDHMFLMNYNEELGWNNPRIVPFDYIKISPAAKCLHYGQEVFEGLKAYRTKDNRILLFRPDKNMARMNSSNERLCIPKIDEKFCVEAIKKLVLVDQDWVPSLDGNSLYIRPFIIGLDSQLGVHPAHELLLGIICSPVGAYYSEGINPVNIYVEPNYVRAVKGGIGFAKTGGNYAASLKAQDEANKEDYTQVLWLDGVHRKYVEEIGAMNVFFIIDDEIITPALEGSILPGVTRMSVIELLKSLGYKVSERRISIDEIVEAHSKGKLKEAFGTGTAAVISPIGKLKYGDIIMDINDGTIGKVSQLLYDKLTDIQWGKVKDEFNWTVEI